MRRPLPLDVLITVPVFVAIVIGFGSFGVYADRAQRSAWIENVDLELVRAETAGNRQLERLNTPAGARTGPAQGRAEQVAIGVEPPVQLRVRRDGRITQEWGGPNPFEETTLRRLVRRSGVSTVNDPPYRVRVTSDRGNRVRITALPLGEVNATLAELRRSILLAGVVIGTIVSALVRVMARRAVRPVTRMAGVAESIAEGATEYDKSPPVGSAETARLGVAFDAMLDRLHTTIEAREVSAAEAMKAHDDMRRFLADAAHELRTPLTALRGYSDLYAAGMLETDGATDRAMSRIGKESERLYELVESMLRLARNEPSPIDHTDVDVSEVAADVTSDMASAYPDRTTALEVLGTHHFVRGNQAELHQAILNLVANALTHSDSERVEVGVKAGRDQVVVTVVDHGVGVAPQDREVVFLPFSRLESSRTRERGGAGLGLAIVARIVHEHSGQVRLEETPGGGATFVVVLPRSQSAAP